MSGLFGRLMTRLIKRGTLKVTYASGETATYGEPTPGYPDVAVRFTDDKVGRDVVLDPRLGAGEAYMDGRIVMERGGVMELVELVQANNRWERRGQVLEPSLRRKIAGHVSFLARSFNKPGSSRRNVAHHYDIGNDLYKLMLDNEHMQYSCAYWPREGMTLEQAQEAKLAHIAAKLAIKPGQNVLDIGCGWGGMAIYLARHYDVSVHGITLSEEQIALAKQRAKEAGVSDKVRFELVDYRALPGRGTAYDRIVSVGMFEHVGRPQFETFFRACANLLTEEGVMLLHTIGRMGKPSHTDAFTDKYVFPGGYIPALSETVAASEKMRLIAADVETLRLHYAKTLREWYQRCLDHREEIVALFDERFFRMWTFYLSGSTAAFESGGMCNYQIQYARNRHALPLMRGYFEEEERRLLGE
uniref:SAM-dependent methyltransferase n=1 Tax=Altererythrobacter segetis TaxID=1104773 RepID=UPI00140A8D0B|nr:cyclopropane-fatty-acyl-phospholipid synthase family protein [Altererythrobacter segetis]